MKQIPRFPIWLLLLVLFSACNREDGAILSPTALSPSVATVAFTETPVLQTAVSPSPFPASTITPTTTPSAHIYTDPEGWYLLDIPAGWQPTDEPNSFAGNDGFFQTGYLPEMMFMSNVMNVCQWLANIDTQNSYEVSWLTTIHGNGCQLKSLPHITPAVVIEIVENPSADFQHRFLYIKANTEQLNHITNTFTWLRPVDIEAESAFHTASL